MTTERFRLNGESLVVELASNDGYLLRNFVAAGIPCLGVEPTGSTADAAQALGIPVLREFFNEPLGRQLYAQGKAADLIIGNNVYAHVPNINDFTRGMKALLNSGGTITLEFPHLPVSYTHLDVYKRQCLYIVLATPSSRPARPSDQSVSGIQQHFANKMCIRDRCRGPGCCAPGASAGR